MAHYQLGELHRLRGELREAEAAYRHAHAVGRDPQPGLALLRLAEGRADGAAAAIESALDAAHDPMARAKLLPAYVRVMLAVGRLDEASAAADELDEMAGGDGEARDETMLGAIAGQTRGALLLAHGDPRAALGPLRVALGAWQALDAPFETAQVRVLLASACRQLDDSGQAELECDVARDIFERLGAAPALEQLERMLADAGVDKDEEPSTAREGRPITDRELQVLRLVAGGSTNRDIAAELSISEKTVERHLGNIFTKLGVSNRTAAAAQAYARDLL